MFGDRDTLWERWWSGWRSCLSKISKLWTLKVPPKHHIPWSLAGRCQSCLCSFQEVQEMPSSYSTPHLVFWVPKEQGFLSSHFMHSFNWKQLLWLLPAETLRQNCTYWTWLMNQYPVLFKLCSLRPHDLGVAGVEWLGPRWVRTE